MSRSFEGLLEEIRQASVITLFRHENPDCDAVGSQLGLKTWLEENFPEKKVYALGNESISSPKWPKPDHVDDAVVRSSLAIVLDTPDIARVDDHRFLSAASIVKIDHHPLVDSYAKLEFVYTDAAATCEILADFFQQMETQENLVFSRSAAEYIFSGLLTDTLSFKTTNTTPHTLATGAYIASKGISIPELWHGVFDVSLHEFQFAGFIRSQAQFVGNHTVYVVVNREDMSRWNMAPGDARSFVSQFMGVREIECWAVFTEKTGEDGSVLFDGSLRSAHVQLNDLAANYHGGGHRNACGVKNLSYEDLKQLLGQMSERAEAYLS